MSPGGSANRTRRWLILLAIGCILLISPLVFMEQIELAASAAVETARDRPLLVAGIMTLLLALDVFLPVPNGVINTLAGAIFGFAGGVAVIWTGLMAASLLGYGTGMLAARPLAQRLLGGEELDRAHRFAQRLGPLVLILSRPVPIFAELATMAAGMASMAPRLFILLTAISNLVVAAVYAAIGVAAMSTGSGALAMLGGAVLPAGAWLAYRRWHTGEE